ncbi:hypothetical protein NCCP436_05950 [Pseudomonas sp. NCCP-436]|nr:hypothetical protein NCCP436_05950 [Pseudomonas sp. NCCP-436]
MLWWLAALALAPLTLPLALHTRRTALRLPPAVGEVRGLAGAGLPGEPFRLLLIGESTVVGVGVEALDQALAACLARELSRRLQRSVRWHACGENGITAVQACQRLLPGLSEERADLALLVFGVNDTTHLTSSRHWRAALGKMIGQLRGQGMQVACSGVPPLQHFRALPWLLRRLLGWRAGLMDREVRALAQRMQVAYCGLNLTFEAQYLAEDGYHPSALGYRLWADGLADQLVRCAE